MAELMTRITQPFANGRVLLFTLPKRCAYTAFKQAVGLKGLPTGAVSTSTAVRLRDLGVAAFPAAGKRVRTYVSFIMKLLC